MWMITILERQLTIHSKSHQEENQVKVQLGTSITSFYWKYESISEQFYSNISNDQLNLEFLGRITDAEADEGLELQSKVYNLSLGFNFSRNFNQYQNVFKFESFNDLVTVDGSDNVDESGDGEQQRVYEQYSNY